MTRMAAFVGLVFLFSTCLLWGQNFQIELTLTPDNNVNPQLRSFGGSVDAKDGYDSLDTLAPPAGLTYYSYFKINEYPRQLWTDIKHWTDPYETDKEWQIVITNADTNQTVISWDNKKIPLSSHHQFIIMTNSDSIDMEKTESAVVNGNDVVRILYREKSATTFFVLTVGDYPLGWGYTYPSPGQYEFPPGTIVDISAKPATGFAFTGWSGDAEDPGSQNTTVIMDGDKWVGAGFTPLEYSLGTTIIGQGSIGIIPDKEFYLHYEQVILTAKPDSGWTFSNWTIGDSVYTNPTISITMLQNTHVIATFVQNRYRLDIAIEGEGIVTREPDSLLYRYGQEVVLTAVADSGWIFSRWLSLGETNPMTITMTENKSVTAIFEKIETFTVNLLTIGQGTIRKQPDKINYYFGEQVIFSALAETGWTFDRWSGAFTSNKNPDTLNISNNIEVTAHFILLTFPLTTTVQGAGRIKTTPEKVLYNYGETVQIQAIADSGWNFFHWQGIVEGSENPTNITISRPTTLTAVFVSSQVFILSTSIEGQGIVQLCPHKPTYNKGETVTLTAVPAEGWFFRSWSGDKSGSDNPINVIMDSNKKITCTFSAQKPGSSELLVVEPVEYNFGQVNINGLKTTVFYLKYNGTKDLLIKKISCTGSHANQFVLKYDNKAMTIAPGKQMELSVTFHPTSEGEKWARIKIETDDPDNTAFFIELSGKGLVKYGDVNISYAYPNPFNPEQEFVTILFTQANKMVQLKIVDANGNLVKELKVPAPEILNTERLITWDGRNKIGEIVANGIYFYILENNTTQPFIGKIAVYK